MNKLKILTIFLIFLNFTQNLAYSNEDGLPFFKLLFTQRPATMAFLEALPPEKRIGFLKVFQSNDTEKSGDKVHNIYHEFRRTSDYTLTVDREDLLAYPALSTWHKDLVVNWKVARYLWDEPTVTPPDHFLPLDLDLSRLKKLTTFAVDYADLVSLTSRLSTQTELHVTLAKTFTPENHYAFLADIEPVIRNSSLYANFISSKTLLIFLKKIYEAIDSRAGEKVMFPYYFNLLCPQLHLFVREVNDKTPKFPLTADEAKELQSLKEKFGEHLHLSYMQDLTPRLHSTLSVLGMSNRVEAIKLLFPPQENAEVDDDNDAIDLGVIDSLDAALNLSQFHSPEIEKAIRTAKPYLTKIEHAHTRTVLVEGLLYIPVEFRQEALDLAFSEAMGDPRQLQHRVVPFYCLHMFPHKDYEGAFPLLEKLAEIKRMGGFLVAAQTIVPHTSRSLALAIAKHYMGTSEQPTHRKERLHMLKDILGE